MGAQLNSPAQVAVEVKNMKLPCGEILTRVSHATCPLELQRKCNLPAGEKYRSWKWEIHVKNPARAEVANWRRIKIDCYRQNQWVKKVVIQYVAPWGISGSNEPPMGYVLSKLAVLERWKEKFPAYRGSVVPTHFQKQVGWGTWLYIFYICYKLAAISNIQPSFVSILFKTPVKHTNPQSGSALSLSSRKGCNKNQHQRCR